MTLKKHKIATESSSKRRGCSKKTITINKIYRLLYINFHQLNGINRRLTTGANDKHNWATRFMNGAAFIAFVCGTVNKEPLVRSEVQRGSMSEDLNGFQSEQHGSPGLF